MPASRSHLAKCSAKSPSVSMSIRASSACCLCSSAMSKMLKSSGIPDCCGIAFSSSSTLSGPLRALVAARKMPAGIGTSFETRGCAEPSRSSCIASLFSSHFSERSWGELCYPSEMLEREFLVGARTGNSLLGNMPIVYPRFSPRSIAQSRRL